MSDLPLGKLIDASQQRDAIHVAVAPVIAGEALQPGQHIGFVDGSTETVAAIADGPRGLQNKAAIGIVDPFLTVKVYPGDRFWMFLYPNTITSLRHDWTHPAFKVAAGSESRQWIEAFAVELDQTYNRLMEAAAFWLEGEGEQWNDHYTYDNSEVYKRVDDAKWATFWMHYETVTGTKAKDPEASFFTCSC